MASSDHHTSPQEASDEASDSTVDSTSDEVGINTCSPCKHKGTRRRATMYCLDCKELLCNSCKVSHQSFKHFRDHKFSRIASDRRVLLDAQVISSSMVYIRMSSDARSPQITGCAFLPNGKVVLCDQGNKNLKLLDTCDSYKIIESLDFPSEPRDVTIVDNKTVLVVLLDHRSVQYVNLKAKMKPGRVILLQKMPLAIEFFDNEIFVACKVKSKKGTGEILVLDREGTVKRRLGMKEDDSFMFDCPSHFTVSRTTKNIFVSDRDTSMVTCLSPSGKIVYQYKSSSLNRARGVYVDAVDNLFVCGESSNNVLILTSTGEKYGSLLTEKDFVKQPCAIAYRQKDGTLVIGCYSRDNLLVFKIQ